MSSQSSEQDLQKKVFELRMLQDTINQLGQQKEMVAQRITELATVSDGLQTIKSIPQRTPIKAQFAPNLFIDATLGQQNGVMMNVGSNIFLPKSFDEARMSIDRQRAELMSFLEKIDSDMNKLTTKFMTLQQSLAGLMR